jgi:hypothetical protein
MNLTIRSTLLAGLALGAAVAAADAAAQTLYKLIDKNGKVTYSESPPKEFDGKVIRIDVDPKANTMTMPKPAAPAAAPATGSDAPRRGKSEGSQSNEDKVQMAKERLESARKTLKDATDNPGESDVRYIGNVGGGTRAVPTEDYQKRIAALEENVKKAEEALRVAEGR